MIKPIFIKCNEVSYIIDASAYQSIDIDSDSTIYFVAKNGHHFSISYPSRDEAIEVFNNLIRKIGVSML